MPAFATMTIDDGQSTPVTHSFVAIDHGNGNFIWRESGTTSVLGAAVMTLTKLKVKGNSTLEKYRVKTIIPALETATGQNSDGYTAQPRIAYTLNSIQDFVVPLRASEAQRKDLIAYSMNVLDQGQIASALHSSIMPS